MIKIYSDGASRGNPGLAGAGALILKDDQEFAEVSTFLGTLTNNAAEYNALILAVKKVRELIPESEHQNQDIQVFADSQLMIRQLTGEYQVKHETIIPLYSELKKLFRGFKSTQFFHIPREENKKADRLANEAIDFRES